MSSRELVRSRKKWILVGALILGACGTSAQTDVYPQTSESTSTTSSVETVASYSPPPDWEQRALDVADRARQAVVAIGWDPPGPLNRRLEAGWLIASDLVVTSNSVACEAQEGKNLRVRTFSGAFVRATIKESVGPCGQWGSGVALLRLAKEVQDPSLKLRGGGEPEVGEPLIVIGHANHAAALGGWLVAVGPMIGVEGDTLLVDIGVSVNAMRLDEWFGGGSNGAPLIDLNGEVVSVLCCEREWGPQLEYDDPISEPLLRRRIVLDERYFIAGLWGDALRSALS